MLALQNTQTHDVDGHEIASILATGVKKKAEKTVLLEN